MGFALQNTFILGVGAQKSGSTWVHHYLKNSPNFNPGLVKEYHIWDALFIETCKKYLVKDVDTQNFVGLNYLPAENALMKDILNLRNRMQSDSLPYEQYFAGLMNGEFNITGDITPSYAGLQAGTYELIKQRLESVGFKVKVVFLMRDPVERCLSASRMQIRNNQKMSVAENLGALYNSKRYSLRTNYHLTILELDKVFEPQDIYYGIFEEMFTEVNIEKFSKFCGVPSNFSWGSEKINSGNDHISIDLELRKEISDFYSEVYAFCNKRFPQTELLWRGCPPGS